METKENGHLMIDPTQFQFTNPSVPKAYEDFLCRAFLSPGQYYCLMRSNFGLAIAALWSRLGRERLRRLPHSVSALAVGSALQISRNQWWLSREASLT
jgi:hypothetical protein